jgi:hypothetical protein
LREGILDDGLGVIGGVHDVVAPGDALLAGPGEGDGDLAVMGRGRSEDGGDGDAGLADIEMQLVADPRTGEAVGVALEADIACGWQFGSSAFSAHFGDRLVRWRSSREGGLGGGASLLRAARYLNFVVLLDQGNRASRPALYARQLCIY